MRWLLLCLLMTGCCKPVYIARCPAPPPLPITEYQTAVLPETTSAGNIVKALAQDLMQCQDTEEQLRLILKGYEGMDIK